MYWPEIFLGPGNTAHNWVLPYRPGPAGRYSQFSGAPPHTTSVARLPGRNSGQKAQKGPQKKKILAEFWLILPKTGRKGAAENFQNKFLIFSCWPNFLDVLAGNFFGTWQHWKQGGQQAGFLAVPARPAGLQLSVLSHTLTVSRSIAVTGSWDSVCWCDRVKMAQQCVVICSWFWLYTDCWCG